jgi:hypothetical protein
MPRASRIAYPIAQPIALAEDPECDSGQCAGDDFGGQDV